MNSPEARRCRKCGFTLASDQSAETAGIALSTSPVPPPAYPSSVHMPVPGDILAERYEIQDLLGQGGMGAVFKARDRELDRLVALKVIRPDLAGDPAVLQRFKQELILAREVTHRNVVRIFDLGQADGIRFITMEYVEGTDLKHVLEERGKLAPSDAVAVVRQICEALQAAHAQGVIHRDLKLQNIMLDAQGRVLVMDFGIARSLETPGATQTGVLMGTPEYMSPEQAKGDKIDTRSDLFSLGIIFYELLTGKSPYKADTVVGTLIKRIQERAVPPSDLDTEVPRALSDVVIKCLAIERNDRYQSAGEVLRDLEHWETRPVTPPKVEALPAPPAAVARPLARLNARWAAAAVLLLMAVSGGLYLLRRTPGSSPQFAIGKPVTLLVADFDNTTGDPVFDGTLESAITLALEGAPFITSYRRGDARKIAAQLAGGKTQLGVDAAKLVAMREGISIIVAGSIARRGSGYRLSAEAIDSLSGKAIAEREADADNKGAVLSVTGKLAGALRRALGDATPESAEAMASETFSAASIEAAHEYAAAQELQWAGKAEEAIATYRKAVELDPNLGRAYAGLAAVNANLGRREEAEKYYKLAMARIDQMSERERLRTLGGYYIFVRNTSQAIEVLQEMVRKYPADSAAISNLAYAYAVRRSLPQALEEGRKALEIYPKNLILRDNLAIYAMYAGDLDTAGREAKAVLEANPEFLKAHVVVALSDLAQDRVPQALEEYARLEKVSPLGASTAALGRADIALYEGKPADAADILEKQVSADLSAGYDAAASVKLAALAFSYLQLGRKEPALAAAEKARQLSRSDSLLFELARFHLAAGQDTRAREDASILNSQFLPEPRAYGRIIQGDLLMKEGKAREAVKSFQEARDLLDTWIGRFDLGRAYLEAGAIPEAHEELELCLKRKGEATSVFMDEVPTYRYFPPLYFYLGRVHAAMQSPDATDSYRSFLAIRGKGLQDEMVDEARRFLAANHPSKGSQPTEPRP